jgi:hypothetical protein
MACLGFTVIVPAARLWKWGRQSELRYVPRPGGRSQVHSAGVDPDRVLLMGSGMAVGWGVTSHDVGLGGALARALTARDHVPGGGVVSLVPGVASSTW